MANPIPRIDLASGLNVPRIVMGLWQVADMERGGHPLDADRAAAALAVHADAGFDAFDMADHYGSAEIIAGRLLALRRGSTTRAFTKWCPAPGPMTPEAVRAGVQTSRDRLGVERIDLMQFHWWQYQHPGYLDALHELAALQHDGWVGHIGLTNFDTDHLRLVLRDGAPVVSNQVSFSLLDRRAAGRLSELCLASGVKLLAYGTLAGGFLGERWLGVPEPHDIADWSKNKYKRFIDTVGGWGALQRVLAAAQAVATKHRVSIANVAVRWVLDHPAVGAAIVGVRPGEREHHDDNRAVFCFKLDREDQARLNDALTATMPVPGDCGDEYRRPPFLTASGDLSHHLDALPPVYPVRRDERGRLRASSGSKWEPIAGYCRALREGDRILVSGTTATHGAASRVVAPGDAEAQAVYIFDKITAAIEAQGGRLSDVVRTRVFLRDAAAWRGVAEVHGRYFGAAPPVNTMIGGAVLIGEGYEVEIEAEAVVKGSGT
jgi:aryl-alcohol dehydrogenase-like predicted oxidoreductase/enamine deaminase RidA (YjgF/YER057c/UK114 family)